MFLCQNSILFDPTSTHQQVYMHELLHFVTSQTPLTCLLTPHSVNCRLSSYTYTWLCACRKGRVSLRLCVEACSLTLPQELYQHFSTGVSLQILSVITVHINASFPASLHVLFLCLFLLLSVYCSFFHTFTAYLTHGYISIVLFVPSDSAHLLLQLQLRIFLQHSTNRYEREEF